MGRLHLSDKELPFFQPEPSRWSLYESKNCLLSARNAVGSLDRAVGSTGMSSEWVVKGKTEAIWSKETCLQCSRCALLICGEAVMNLIVDEDASVACIDFCNGWCHKTHTVKISKSTHLHIFYVFILCCYLWISFVQPNISIYFLYVWSGALDATVNEKELKNDVLVRWQSSACTMARVVNGGKKLWTNAWALEGIFF